jgi:hypothetical protein
MAMMAQSPHDPVLAALGLAQDAGQDMSQMMYQATAYDYTTDPAQYAWSQAQAMATVAWQLQQVASWQAQVAASYSAQTYDVDTTRILQLSAPNLIEGPNASALTPRGSINVSALETTPAKTTSASDRSTDVGSPSGGESEVGSQGGNSDIGSPHGHDSDTLAAEALQAWLAKEVAGASVPEYLASVPMLPPPPPPCMTPTKLDLHAIIFENAKDPISAQLLQLIKGPESADSSGKAQGKELLGMLNQKEVKEESSSQRTRPIASGAHRRAAVAARAAAAAKLTNEEPVSESIGTYRRRPRGTRGGRGGRGH